MLVLLLSLVAFGSQELDRQFQLEKIGALKSYDNIDGILTETIADGFNQYFGKQNRFKYQDISKADALLSQSKLPLQKLLEDSRIIGQIGKAYQLQSLIRTKVFKDGAQYQVHLDWLRVPQVQLLAQHTFTVTEAESSASTLADVLKAELQKQIPKLIAKVPFKAHITGRDGDTLVVNLGKDAGIFKGDLLVVQSLEDVKIHPLTKTVVDWQFVKVGRLKVVDSDDSLAFCKVLDVEENQEMAINQKITAIIPHDDTEEKSEKKKTEEFEAPYVPRIGWILGGVDAGGFSRNFNDSSVGGLVKSGGGLAYGLKASGELWLTRQFFFDLDLAYNINSYSQTDAVTNLQTASINGSYSRFKANFGYQYHLSPDYFGPRLMFRMGYQSNSYGIPASTPDVIAGATFTSIFLGVGFDLPLRPQWGILTNLDLGMLKSVSNPDQVANAGGTALSPATGITDISFFLGGYYWVHSRLMIRGGIDIYSQGATFGTITISDRLVLFSPSIVYYF